MAKFKVLQNNQRFLSSVLRIDVERKNDARLKSADSFFTSTPVLSMLFIFVSVFISNAVRILNSSYDFTDRLAAALLFIGMCQTITIFLSTGVNMPKSLDLYQALQEIVEGEGESYSIFKIWILRFIHEIISIFFSIQLKMTEFKVPTGVQSKSIEITAK